MRASIYFLLLLCLTISCGDKTTKTVQGVGGSSKFYRGYNLIAAATKCEIPQKNRLCPQGHNEIGLMNIDFAAICESNGARAFDCGCKEKYLCSIKLDILVSGYNIKKQKRRGIPHKDIINCPDSGAFPPDSPGKIQERFRSRCESLGHTATLTGCAMKRYLCSRKI